VYLFVSAFRSLLLASIVTALYPFPTWAESEEPLEVKEVVVSSTRLPGTPVDARTLPAKVTVISAEDMRKSGAKTVQEAIQWATGLVMYDQSGNAFQQTIDLRGFNGQPVPATTVFVDGIRVNEPDFNTVNFDLIPFDTIERIEILPGASAIHGKNALGGVINIITKRGEEKHQATVDTQWGSFQRQRYTINASGPIGKFDYYANFGREMEDGFRDDSGARISRFSGRVGYRPSDQTDLSVSYNYVKDKLHQAGQLPLTLAEVSPTLNFTPGDLDAKELNFVRGTARQMLPFGLSLSGNVFYRHLDQDLLNVGQPFLVGGVPSEGTTLTKTEQRGGTAQLAHDEAVLGRKNHLMVGGELIRNNFTSSLSSFSDFGPFASSVVAEENILAAYAHDSLYLLPNVILTGGVRYDYQRLTADSQDSLGTVNNGSLHFHRTTPRGGITYLITDNLSAYYNYSEGFRVPTTQEMFTLAGQPNLALKPIHSKNHEFGFNARFGAQAEGSVTLYQSTSNDIFFSCTVCEPTTPAFDGQNRNAEEVRRRGIETTVKARWKEYVDAVINYSYTEAEFRSSFNLSQTKTVQRGNEFPLVPHQRLGFVINTHPIKELTVSLTGLYVGSQVYLNDENNAQPRLPHYFVMNMRVAYEQPVPGGRLTGFFSVNNFTSNHYFTFGSIAQNNLTGNGNMERFVTPAPDIAFYGGLSYRFEGLSQ
jgi:iron complex outermembrane receptor protein